jgi:hypothetical protein
MSNANNAPRSLLHRIGVAGPARLRACQGIGVSTALLLALVLLAPGVANAAFTRPFLSQITGTCETPGEPQPCAGSKPIPFEGPLSVAVDKEDNLWVGDGAQSGGAQSGLELKDRVDEFGPAYSVPPSESLQTVDLKGNLVAPRSLAVERVTGQIYVAGEEPTGYNYVEVFESAGATPGKLVKRWKVESSGPIHVAIDNSTEPLDPSRCSLSECFVYVATSGGQKRSGGIARFTATGAPADFPAGPCVSANEITCTKNPAALTVDPAGNIYVIDESSEVQEFNPEGELVHTFKGTETPGLKGGANHGALRGVAVDPLSDHLLISASAEEEGAVYEFDIKSGRYLNEITEASEGVRLHDAFGVAVDSHGDVYVMEDTGEHGLEHAIDVYGPGRFDPSVRFAEPSGVGRASAVLNGSVNPEAEINPAKKGLSECYFEYVSETAFNKAVAKKEAGFSSAETAACEPDAAQIPASEQYTPVHAEATNLESGETYRYRLTARTEEPLGGITHGEALAFTALHAPRIESSTAGNLSSSFAELKAVIDPLGADTSYFFEYGPTTSYGHDAPLLTEDAPHGASIGSGGASGSSQESVLQHIEGLAPGTTYYYRVVAENECEAGKECVAAETAQSKGTFTTLPAPEAGLPDHRAYELVTPTNKGGSGDMFAEEAASGGEFANNKNTGRPSESGDEFLLETEAGFGPFPSAGSSAYVFQREPQREWTYKSLASPALGVQSINDKVVFDPADLSSVAFTDLITAPGEGGAQANVLDGAAGGPYTTLRTDAAFHAKEGAGRGETVVAGASHDLGHVVLESPFKEACGGAVTESLKAGDVLCESDGSGELQLVNEQEGKLLSQCGAQLGAGLGVGEGEGNGGQTHNAVSIDGSRMFLTAPDPSVENSEGKGGCWNGATTNAPQLYARVAQRGPSGEVTHTTIRVTEPEEGVKASGSYVARYVGASEDGTKVFFVTEGWLTANHPKVHDPELYECELVETEEEAPKCKLTRISASEPENHGASEPAGEVAVVDAVAAQGGAVYFTANGVLAAGAGAAPGDCTGTYEGLKVSCNNLYRYQTETAGTPAKLTYIATVNAADCLTWGASCAVTPRPFETRAYTTPDGRYLLFDTHELAPGTPGGGGEATAMELYRYDSLTASLACVSCNPDGMPSSGGIGDSAEFTRSAGFVPDAGQVRAMSDNGEYVFFDSAEKLVSTADNHTLDVYEWHHGHVALLSSGEDPTPSFFLGYSPNPQAQTEEAREAGNVFIGTHANLIPMQNTESQGNIFDARSCEPESPCIEPPPGGTGQCLGSTCQSPPAAPADPTATLLAPPSPVNLAPPPPKKIVTKTLKCKKGLVRKKVKKKETCVQKPQPKKRAKKASHNGRGK